MRGGDEGKVLRFAEGRVEVHWPTWEWGAGQWKSNGGDCGVMAECRLNRKGSSEKGERFFWVERQSKGPAVGREGRRSPEVGGWKA